VRRVGRASSLSECVTVETRSQGKSVASGFVSSVYGVSWDGAYFRSWTCEVCSGEARTDYVAANSGFEGLHSEYEGL